MKKTAHVISHSHWDREWYMPFETHRMYLVRLIDTCMDLFESDPEFKSFYLDGQTIVLDDYLQIRPQKKEQLLKYIREGRFIIGPWYILQDEFLTSGEANIRNLLTGRRKVLEYGGSVEEGIGYFPDAFGNVGQMPQILKQAGIKAIAFGRGVKSVGANNQVTDQEQYTSAFSEMIWESPDGSGLPAILFANWYNNGVEIPTDRQPAKEWWDRKLAEAEMFAGTDQLLFMNGCDHQPVQKNISEALRVAKELYPDIEFIHSDFPSYVRTVTEKMGDQVTSVRGELTSQETDGRWTLANTASSHIELKIRNRQGELALEHTVEPLSVMAFLNGAAYPEDELHYAWETLMQNHPHDSICCCSHDLVMKEMDVRFDKSIQVADFVTGSAKEFLAKGIQRSLDKTENVIAAFTVFHTGGMGKRRVLTSVLDIDRCWDGELPDCYDRMQSVPMPQCRLLDSEGNQVDAIWADAGVGFGYTLPDDRFRRRYMARRMQVTYEAEIPPLGYQTYFVVKCEEEQENVQSCSMLTDERTMENEYIRIRLMQDGTYSVTEKQTGKTFENLGWYEDCGDHGNEYIYIAAKNCEAITTCEKKALIRVKEDTPLRCTFEVRQSLFIPKSGDSVLEREREKLTEYYERNSGRSEEYTELPIITEISLEKSSKGARIVTKIENCAKDHRVRVMFPTKLDTDCHYADSVFEVVKRPNVQSKEWTNPSACQRQQQFVSMEDKTGGLLIANLGLNEYEILPEQENCIAVTLLRCTGEMGDWGVFPTETSQMQGKYRLQYEVIPFAIENKVCAITEGRQFQEEPEVIQLPIGCAGELPPGEARVWSDRVGSNTELKKSYLDWSGSGLHLTACKKAENEDALVFRWVNDLEQESTLELKGEDWMRKVYFSNVCEESAAELEERDGWYRIMVKPYEIVTIKAYRSLE